MKILRDGSIYLVGEGVAALIPFLFLPYLTRMLGVEGFGEFSFYYAFVAIGTVILGFSQDSSLARYYVYYGKKAVPYLNVLGSLITVIGVICISIIGLIFESELALIISFLSFLHILVAKKLRLLQMQKKALNYLMFRVTVSLLSVLLTIVLFEFLSASVTNRFYGMLIANLIPIIILAFYSRVKFTKFTRHRCVILVKYLFNYGGPLIIHHSSNLAKSQLDRIIVFSFFTASELGVYSLAIQLASVISLIYSAVFKALNPYYFEGIKKRTINRMKVLNFAKIAVAPTFIVPLIVLLIPESLYIFLFPQEFENLKYFILVFVFGFSLNLIYFCLVPYLWYFNKNKVVASTNLFSAILHIVFLFVFAKFGIEYMPFASIISTLFLIIFIGLAVWKTKGYNDNANSHAE